MISLIFRWNEMTNISFYTVGLTFLMIIHMGFASLYILYLSPLIFLWTLVGCFLLRRNLVLQVDISRFQD